MIRKLPWISAIVILLLLIAIPLFAPHYIKSFGIKKLEENCKGCSLKIGDLDINFFTGSFAIKELEFRYLEKKWIQVDWMTDRIDGTISISKLLHGEVYLGKIIINKATVQLFDSDGPDPQDDNKTAKSDLIFVLKGLEVKHGKFTYVNETQGRISQLNIPYVSAVLGELGNTPELKSKSVEAIGRGRVEKTGDVVMKINTYIFDWPPVKVDVDISSTSHDLSDLTTFFNAFAGVSLKGHMLEGSGTVQVRGNKAKTSITARYKDFDVQIKEMYDRSASKAFFMSLGKAITFDDKNIDKDKKLHKRSAEITREPKESIPGFILRSLREAAIAVVSA